MASRDAVRATVDTCGREVGRPKNGKARMIGPARWLRDMLAEQLTRPAPGAGPEHTAFHAASGKAVYRTVFVRGVFGPAEAALPAEKQGRRFHDLRHLRATLLIAAGAHREARTGATRALQHHRDAQPVRARVALHRSRPGRCAL